MKMNLNSKLFQDKVTLQKSLDTLLKKPLTALLEKKVTELPFCYESEYFDDGGGFISIGVAKEIQKEYKSKRTKGNGHEGKVDKKKTAYGVVRLNDEGLVEFCIKAGVMKLPQVKKAIKSIGILKKKIDTKFVIIDGIESKPTEDAAKPENTANENQEATTASTKPVSASQKVLNDLQDLIKNINLGMKDDIATDVVANIKNEDISNKDIVSSDNLLNQIEDLKNVYNGAEDKVKDAISKHYTKAVGFTDKVSKIKEKVAQLLNKKTTAATDEALNDGRAALDSKALEKVLSSSNALISDLFSNGSALAPEQANKERRKGESFLQQIGTLIGDVADDVKAEAETAIEKLKEVIKIASDAEVNNTSTDDLVSEPVANPLELFVNEHI